MTEPFILIKSETIPLTLELAEKHKHLQSPPTERPLKKERVKFLQEKAEAGLFLPVSWATAQIGDNKAPKVRVNGQHSSVALCDLKENFPKTLQCHLDHYRVKDEKSLVQLFRQFDARMSNRTKSDIAGAYQLMNKNLMKLKPRFAKLSVEGIGWWRRQLEGLPVPPGDGVYEIFQEENEHPFLEWNNGILTMKTPELCNRAIVAAMYESYMADKTDAKKFWALVAQGGGYDNANHPATILDDWLKALKERGQNTKPGTLYQGCMYAWNAFRQEKSIPTIKSDSRRALLRSV
jgi:hypothetical protein